MYSIVVMMSLSGSVDLPVARRGRCCGHSYYCCPTPVYYHYYYPCAPVYVMPKVMGGGDGTGGKTDGGKKGGGGKTNGGGKTDGGGTGDVKMSKDVKELIEGDAEIKAAYNALKTKKEKQDFVDKIQKEFDKGKKEKKDEEVSTNVERIAGKSNGSARIEVTLPETGTLIIDNYTVPHRSDRYTYITSPLSTGEKRTILLKSQNTTKTVTVTGGETLRVRLAPQSSEVAGR